MNTAQNIAVKNPDNTCCNCLKETQVHKIIISALGYSSSFDNKSTQINLCDTCLQGTNQEWWKLKVIGEEEYLEKYEYEKEILEFISTLPLVGRELVENHYASGACADYMESQDWIDYELDILPHEKCKEYMLYSPDEIKAYEDRFPNCKHVVINVSENGYKSSKCFNSAYGNGDGKCEHISESCYMCENFEEREGEINVVDTLEEFYKREKERLLDMIEYATNRLEMIENKTLKENV